MIRSWWYRMISVTGASVITALAVVIANNPFLQELVTTHVPLLWRLEPIVLSGTNLELAAGTSILLILGSLYPLFKPRPWRLLDVIIFTQKRVLIAGFAIAALGYFNYSFRLPRTTLSILIGILLIVMPLWFVAIRTQSKKDSKRAIVVGDDMAQIERIITESNLPVLGYLCPPTAYRAGGTTNSIDKDITIAIPDGGNVTNKLSRLGGLSKLETVLIEQDVDTACLAFRTADRGDFFGALDLCHKHGVNAKVHREYVDDVLTSSEDVGTLVNVDIEPWDPQDYVFKRLFDVAFAGIALLILSPVITLIAIAIKLEGEGPIFFEQERTCPYGNTFIVRKFRTLKPTNDNVDLDISEDRKTPLGNMLRTTHLDEIPQLWAILTGDMSVVGPRPAITDLEQDYVSGVVQWRQRWFVKPGLTGLAQINDATGHEPERKLKYDIEYIQNQSFWFDVKIVVRQLWKVVEDVTDLVRQ